MARRDAARDWTGRLTRAGNAGLSDYLLAGKKPPPLRKRHDKEVRDSNYCDELSLSQESDASIHHHDATSDDVDTSAEAMASNSCEGSTGLGDGQMGFESVNADNIVASSRPAQTDAAATSDANPDTHAQAAQTSGMAAENSDKPPESDKNINTVSTVSRQGEEKEAAGRVVLPQLAEPTPQHIAMHASKEANVSPAQGVTPRRANQQSLGVLLPNNSPIHRPQTSSKHGVHTHQHNTHMQTHKTNRRPPSPDVKQHVDTAVPSPPHPDGLEQIFAFGPSPRRARIKKVDQSQEAHDAHGDQNCGNEGGHSHDEASGGRAYHGGQHEHQVRRTHGDSYATSQHHKAEHAHAREYQHSGHNTIHYSVEANVHGMYFDNSLVQMPESIVAPSSRRHVSYKSRRPSHVDVSTPSPGIVSCIVYIMCYQFMCTYIQFVITQLFGLLH